MIYEKFSIAPPLDGVTRKIAHPNPEATTPLVVFGIVCVEDPAMPKGVAVFLDKTGKEVGRITNIGED